MLTSADVLQGLTSRIDQGGLAGVIFFSAFTFITYRGKKLSQKMLTKFFFVELFSILVENLTDFIHSIK